MVVAFNGSPKAKGNTYHAIRMVADELEMVMPTSNYWHVAYGTDPSEVAQDEEGKQIMRVLGKNMAWLMKVLEVGKPMVDEPAAEEKVFTHFIR